AQRPGETREPEQTDLGGAEVPWRVAERERQPAPQRAEGGEQEERHQPSAEEKPVTDDQTAALLRSPDRAIFVGSPRELNHVLDAPAWCVFLQPTLHRLARWEAYEQPILVTGGAGTGKTLLALHRSAFLARRGAGQILLVTFSQRLSTDLDSRLDLLIEDEVTRKRIEVGNVDRLAHRIVAEAEGRAPAL
ncbi:UvrD-helicase domain-containing protein, partial [Streptosporangium algeriense]